MPRRRKSSYVRMQPIVPKVPLLHADEIKRAIKKAEEWGAKEIQKEYEGTVKTWDTKPKFQSKVTQRLVLQVWTEDKRYAWVDLGTPPHVIGPKGGSGFLQFDPEFEPKTTPGVLKPGRGRARSGSYVRPRAVIHPGIEARNFSRLIEAKWGPKLGERIQRELSKIWLDRAGAVYVKAKAAYVGWYDRWTPDRFVVIPGVLQRRRARATYYRRRHYQAAYRQVRAIERQPRRVQLVRRAALLRPRLTTEGLAVQRQAIALDRTRRRARGERAWTARGQAAARLLYAPSRAAQRTRMTAESILRSFQIRRVSSQAAQPVRRRRRARAVPTTLGERLRY